MVVFEQGVPQKKEYRRFQIRTSGNNDFASMQEMLSRRFKRTGAERARQERTVALASARSGERDLPAPHADLEEVARMQENETRPELGDTVKELVFKEQLQDGSSRNGAGDRSDWTGWAVLPTSL